VETVAYIWEHEKSANRELSRQGRPMDWPVLLRSAEKEYREHSDNNPFGFDNRLWDRNFRADEAQRRKRPRTDRTFQRGLESSEEWINLALVLQELRELGAQPLVVSAPLHGAWYHNL